MKRWSGLRLVGPGRGLTAGVAVLAGIVLVAACGSSSAKSSGGTAPAGGTVPAGGTAPAGTAASSTAKGSPITMMVVSPFTGTGSFPEAKPATDAEAKSVNASGGVDGHPVKLIFCDTQANPNIASSCYRSGVSSHVAAFVGEIPGYADFPVTDAAKIPLVDFCACEPGSDTDPGDFPLQGAVPYYVELGDEMRLQNCQKPGILVNVQALGKTITAAMIIGSGQAAHAKSVPVSYIDPSTPSTDAPVAAVLAKGVDCVAAVLTGNQLVSAVQALRQQAPNDKVFTTFSAAGPQVIQQLGSGATGMIITGPSLTPSDTWSPVIRNINAAIKKYDSGGVVTGFSSNMWAALQVALAAAKNVLDSGQALNGPSEWNALNQMTNYQTGVLAPTTFNAKGSGVPGETRIFDFGWTVWKIDSAGVAQIQNKNWTQTAVSEMVQVPTVTKEIGG